MNIFEDIFCFAPWKKYQSILWCLPSRYYCHLNHASLECYQILVSDVDNLARRSTSMNLSILPNTPPEYLIYFHVNILTRWEKKKLICAVHIGKNQSWLCFLGLFFMIQNFLNFRFFCQCIVFGRWIVSTVLTWKSFTKKMNRSLYWMTVHTGRIWYFFTITHYTRSRLKKTLTALILIDTYVCVCATQWVCIKWFLLCQANFAIQEFFPHPTFLGRLDAIFSHHFHLHLFRWYFWNYSELRIQPNFPAAPMYLAR